MASSSLGYLALMASISGFSTRVTLRRLVPAEHPLPVNKHLEQSEEIPPVVQLQVDCLTALIHQYLFLRASDSHTLLRRKEEWRVPKHPRLNRGIAKRPEVIAKPRRWRLDRAPGGVRSSRQREIFRFVGLPSDTRQCFRRRFGCSCRRLLVRAHFRAGGVTSGPLPRIFVPPSRRSVRT